MVSGVRHSFTGDDVIAGSRLIIMLLKAPNKDRATKSLTNVKNVKHICVCRCDGMLDVSL